MPRPDCQQKGHRFPKPPRDRMSQASGGQDEQLMKMKITPQTEHDENWSVLSSGLLPTVRHGWALAMMRPHHWCPPRTPGRRKPSQLGFPATWNYSPAVEALRCCDGKREEWPQREGGRRLFGGKERIWSENQWHGSPSLLRTFWTLNYHPNPVRVSEFSCDNWVDQGLEKSSNATVLTLPWEPFLQDCGKIYRTLD